MTKCKISLFISVFCCLFLFWMSTGWTAIQYGVTTTPSFYVNPDSILDLPLYFNIMNSLQSYSLMVTYDSNKLKYMGYMPEGVFDNTENFHLAVNMAKEGLINISAMLKQVGTLKSTTSCQLVMMIKFKVIGNIGASDTISISGVNDPQNQVNNMTVASSKVEIKADMYTLNVNAVRTGSLPASYEVRLWGTTLGNDKIDQKKPSTTDLTVFTVPAGNYYVMAQAPGYSTDKIGKFIYGAGTASTFDPNQVTITFSALTGKVDLIRRTTTDNYLELNFSYVGPDGIRTAWDPKAPLILDFYGADESFGNFDPNGPTIYFDPNIDGGTFTQGICKPGSGLKTNGLFNSSYISVIIDPNEFADPYYQVKDKKAYTLAFKVGSSPIGTFNFEAFNTSFTFDKPPADPIKVTEMSMVQTTSSFNAAEITSLADIPLQGDFFMDEAGGSAQLKASFSASNIDVSYLKVDGSYIDPNELLTKKVNLALQVKPDEKDPDATVVHIEFKDAEGKPIEYNPPEDVLATVGAIEFDIPLHKDLQKQYKYAETILTGTWDSADAYYTDSNVTDQVAARLISKDSQKKEKGYYGIYYQTLSMKKPEPFIPRVQYGEGFYVWADSDTGLFYAHVITKHASLWKTDELIIKEKKEEDDEWYECFIKAIRPRSLFRLFP